jgi:hypothetical protein
LGVAFAGGFATLGAGRTGALGFCFPALVTFLAFAAGLPAGLLRLAPGLSFLGFAGLAIAFSAVFVAIIALFAPRAARAYQR